MYIFRNLNLKKNMHPIQQVDRSVFCPSVTLLYVNYLRQRTVLFTFFFSHKIYGRNFHKYKLTRILKTYTNFSRSPTTAFWAEWKHEDGMANVRRMQKGTLDGRNCGVWKWNWTQFPLSNVINCHGGSIHCP